MPTPTKSDFRRIQKVLDWQKQVEQPLQRILKQTRPRKVPKIIGTGAPLPMIVEAPDGGIPARDGNRIFGKMCKIPTITEDGDDLLIDVPPDAEEKTVYNYLTIVALNNGEKYGQAFLQADGHLWACSDDCHDTGAK